MAGWDRGNERGAGQSPAGQTTSCLGTEVVPEKGSENRQLGILRAGPQALTMGAGFPPDTMQTSVKFWAWYRLKGAGESAATTSIDVGGASKGKDRKE